MTASSAAAKRRARSSRRDAGILALEDVPQGLLQEPGDAGGRDRSLFGLDDPQDARAGGLEEFQAVRRIWPRRGHLHLAILDRLAPDGKLVVIDTNPDFIRYLKHDQRSALLRGAGFGLGRAADHSRSRLRKSRLHRIGPPLLDAPARPASAMPSSRRPTRCCAGTAPSSSTRLYNPAVKNFLGPHFEHIDHDMEWRNIHARPDLDLLEGLMGHFCAAGVDPRPPCS